MRSFFAFLFSLLVLAGVALYASAFIVHQNDQALVLRFGSPQQVITAPGLNWKFPFVDTVEYFDRRIRELNTNEQEVIAADQQRLRVDAYSRFRVTNPLQFYQNIRSFERVRDVVGPLVESSIRSVLGSATLQEIVQDKREPLMRSIKKQVNDETKGYGLEIVDVRLKRTNLPKENLDKVYERMKADRVREATELRAQGEAEKNRISADAEREVTVIKAEATKKSDQLRGEGEAERNHIFADAFGRDPDFFRFYRSMQAYTQALKPGDTRMLLSPDSEFFRYFEDPSGRKGSPPAAAVPSPAPAPPR